MIAYIDSSVVLGVVLGQPGALREWRAIESGIACASQPFPVALGTLDAIHLATALLWRERSGTDLVLATHDSTLGLAARSVGFRVIGLSPAH